MTLRRLPFVLLLIVPALSACAGKTESMGRTRGAPPKLAVTTDLLGPGGDKLGSATVSQEKDGVAVAVSVEGLPPGSYGIHLHAVGKCEGPAFASAGGHFNPGMKMHGSMNPAGEHGGDLPNIEVGGDRHGRLSALRPGLRLVDGDAPLIDADGAAVVLHAKPDDYRTDPSGNSGTRIACGVLAYGKPVAK